MFLLIRDSSIFSLNRARKEEFSVSNGNAVAKADQ
jgi:hypothetical protein